MVLVVVPVAIVIVVVFVVAIIACRFAKYLPHHWRIQTPQLGEGQLSLPFPSPTLLLPFPLPFLPLTGSLPFPRRPPLRLVPWIRHCAAFDAVSE